MSIARLCLLVALTFALVATVCFAEPAVEVPVYRAIMFDRRAGKSEENGDPFGTRSVLIRGPLSVYTSASESQADTLYRKQTVYVPCGEVLTKTTLTRLSLGGLRGLLVAQCLEGPSMVNEEALAMFLSTSSAPFPIYILPASSQGALDEVVAQVQPGGRHAGNHLVLSVARSARLSPMLPNRSIDAITISSNLIHSRKAMTAASPRVMLTAHFDSLGVAPTALTTAGASGAVSALELWRRALALEADSESSEALAPHALSMLIGSTARENYVSTSSWLANMKESDVDQLKLVVCLDELLTNPVEMTEGSAASGDRPRLFMHIHDTFHRRADGKQVTELAEQVAAKMNVDLKVVTAKTNYQHYDIRFEHEVFANRQVAAVTFSVSRQPHLDQLVRGGVAQTITEPAVKALQARVDFVHAFVSAVLYGSNAPSVEKTAWPGASSYLQGQLQFAATTPRSPVAQHGEAVHRYGEALAEHLRQQNTAVRSNAQVSAVTMMQTDHVRLPNVVLYGPYEETLKVFVTKQWFAQIFYAVLASAAVFAFGVVEFGGVAGVKRLVFPPKE